MAALLPLSAVKTGFTPAHGHIVNRAEFSGQKALRQRAVSPNGNVIFNAFLNNAFFHQTPDQGIRQLVGHNMIIFNLFHGTRAVITHTNGADLSVFDQFFKGTEGFLVRDFPAGPVNLVNVNIVCIHTLQARFAVSKNIVVMQAVGVNLGGDNCFVASSFYRFAKDFFAFSVAVFFRGIKQGNPSVHCRVNGVN